MRIFILLIVAIVLQPHLSAAQALRRPVLDITSNPQAWAKQNANICVQWMALPRMGFCVSGKFNALESVQGNFLTQSRKLGFYAETRLYLFGTPRSFHLKNKARPYERRKRGIGCFGHAGNKLGKAVSVVKHGLYFAPGFVFEQEKLDFLPLPAEGNPLTNFNYRIRNAGGSMALGCQIRFGRLTFGAGWRLQITKPNWAGPKDIFGDSLYNITFPWKLNVQYSPRIEVGINF